MAADMADQVWFSIIPINEMSKAIVNHSENQGHVVVITEEAGATPKKVIQVIFGNSLAPNCILSFGRQSDCSIKCDLSETAFPRKMAQKQCTFYSPTEVLSWGIIPKDGQQQFLLRSHTLLAKWHMDGIPRQRAIPEYGDWRISMGPATFLLRFSKNLKWWERNLREKKTIAEKIVLDRLALTDSPDSPNPPLQPRRETRVKEPDVPRDRRHDAIVYHELEKIGKGAIGSVSRVMDLQTGRKMAVKTIFVKEGKEKDPKETARREVEFLARCRHPHIVDFVHSQGWEMGKSVEIFMPLADGSLRRFSSTKMEREDVDLVSRQMVDALKYLHREGIMHEDIKPENILYEKRITGTTFLLADFGYATRIGSENTCVGTQIYFAPEVWSGAQVGFGLDIWSLGVVIYEISKDLSFNRRSGITDRIFAPQAWCNSLEYVCRNGGDLAKMVTVDVNRRATAKNLHTSPGFPNIPADLPCIFALPKTGE